MVGDLFVDNSSRDFISMSTVRQQVLPQVSDSQLVCPSLPALWPAKMDGK
jgi:hypothetical protein